MAQDRDWNFDPDKPFCVIGIPVNNAQGRTWFSSAEEAVEHAGRLLTKPDASPSLLVVQAVKRVELAAPPIVAHDIIPKGARHQGAEACDEETRG